jgi:hypothetical protein
MFTTTKDIPMSYSHLSTTERFTLYQYRTSSEIKVGKSNPNEFIQELKQVIEKKIK